MSDSGIAGKDHGWGPSVPGSHHGVGEPGYRRPWICSQWPAPEKPSLCYFSMEPVQGSMALFLCSGSWGGDILKYC